MGLVLGYRFFDGISLSKTRVIETNPYNTFSKMKLTKLVLLMGLVFKKSYQKTNPNKKLSFLKFSKKMDISSGLVSKGCVLTNPVNCTRFSKYT